MKTYKGMTRFQLIEKIVAARAEECKKENSAKYNDGFSRINEKADEWRGLYKSYPMTSKAFPMFSLSAEYDRFYA